MVMELFIEGVKSGCLLLSGGETRSIEYSLIERAKETKHMSILFARDEIGVTYLFCTIRICRNRSGGSHSREVLCVRSSLSLVHSGD